MPIAKNIKILFQNTGIYTVKKIVLAARKFTLNTKLYKETMEGIPVIEALSAAFLPAPFTAGLITVFTVHKHQLIYNMNR